MGEPTLFRDRLLAARRRIGLTQGELGAKMVPPASKQQICNLEAAGNPTLETIQRLALALAVDPRWLACGARGWQEQPGEAGAYWIRPRLEDGDPYWADHPQYVYRSGCPGSSSYDSSPWYFATSRWTIDGQPLDGRMVCPVEGPPTKQQHTA